MPLVAWSVLGYSAALIVALSGRAPQRLAVGALALLLAVVFTATGRRVAAMICAIAAGAVLIASAIAVGESHCLASLASVNEWHAELETDVNEGDVTHVRVQASNCASRATLLVSRGSAHAGDRVRVRGRGTADDRGLFIEDVQLDSAVRGPLLLRARAAAGARIDRVFGDDAPMVRALVIADMSAIPAEQRDRYARAGLVHMLSVSGLHVGIIALALELLASVLRLPRTPARIATLLMLSAYVAAIGAPAPAVRAAVMLGALLMTRLLQRPTSPWAILALGAAAPLWDPPTALDLGWQLSVAGTAALIAGGALAKRIIPKTWGGKRRALATGGVVSIVATAVTAPLSAWAFGRVALLGPVTNLLADPVMGLLQPLLFVAMAIPLRGVEAFVADAAHALLAAFDGIARGAARIPGGAPLVLPTVLGAVASGACSIALIVACVSRRPSRASIVGALCVAVLVVEPVLPRARAPSELHMIDVGQGDALALRTSRGRWIVVDAGRSWIGGDAGRNTVAPYLAHLGGDVALFVLSHPHADHVGGAASLFAMLHPRRFLDPGYAGASTPYRDALSEARREGIPWQRVHPGDSLLVDDIVLTALAPDSVWTSRLNDANLASAVLMARIGDVRILFTGDAEAEEEEWLLEHYPDALHADVLKVAHHGSATSTTSQFLAAVRPRVALVSVGAHNSYGHPDAEVMDALRAADVATLRTDRLGTVVLRFLREGIEVRARGESWIISR
ncbi:MAG: DNA internalization-related competence protein ComEC/Rec2 [Gemmatimonadaceae bacterium]